MGGEGSYVVALGPERRQHDRLHRDERLHRRAGLRHRRQRHHAVRHRVAQIGGQPRPADRERGLARAEQVADQRAVGLAGDHAGVEQLDDQLQRRLRLGSHEAVRAVLGEHATAEGVQDRRVGVGVAGLVGQREHALGERRHEVDEALEGRGRGIGEVRVDVERDALGRQRDAPDLIVRRDRAEDGIGVRPGLERVADRGHDLPPAVVPESLVGVDEQVRPLAEGDRRPELVRHGVVGQGQQLDRRAVPLLDELHQRRFFVAAVGVPQPDGVVRLGRVGHDEGEESGERQPQPMRPPTEHARAARSRYPRRFSPAPSVHGAPARMLVGPRPRVKCPVSGHAA